MTDVDSLSVKIFADGADLDGIERLAANPLIKGFTTNPTLMRKAGVEDYEAFARQVLEAVPDLPVSFEVFADEFDEMERQARTIAGWGDNVNVKIPVTNTRREFAGPLVERLSGDGVRTNVTALMTLAQVESVCASIRAGTPTLVSVFAGRVADTGRDPVPIMRDAVAATNATPGAELLWASPREILNVFQADAIGCHVITVTHDLLGKLAACGKDLDEFSLETVKMFHDDASSAGYEIRAAEVSA